MLQTHEFVLFLTACTILALTPGPGMMYVLTRTLAGGRREGIASSLGTFLGGTVHVFAAAAGLSVILARSAVLFSMIKLAGAGYLIFLGIRMFWDSKKDSQIGLLNRQGQRSPLIQGIVTEVLNPKTALFFLSFIPQFVPRQTAHAFTAFVILGLISVILNTTGDLIAVILAGPLRNLLTRSVRARIIQRRASGTAMIALGAYVAVSDS
jgi:threonine/homoserine/homoserine lactone efflux protein